MQTERAKVLEMLASGAITVDQATQLLDAIGWGTAGAPGGAAPLPQRVAHVGGRHASGPVAGFTTEELAELYSHGVTPDYLREMWAAGFRELTAEELAELYSHGVDAAYLRGLRDAGLTDLSVDEVTELANHGVSADYVREMREAGYGLASAEELAELHGHGVTPDYLREMRGARTPAAGAGPDDREQG
jgi:hypothetical protein